MTEAETSWNPSAEWGWARVGRLGGCPNHQRACPFLEPGCWTLPYLTSMSSGCLDFGEGTTVGAQAQGPRAAGSCVTYICVFRHVASPLGPQLSLLEAELTCSGLAREGVRWILTHELQRLPLWQRVLQARP
uniref:Uncharacterized protein n=1 Tax=Molossus molossus TaxID=27622 RepID=A0A7J8JXN9_MOLMO|nr:hypothetical protein HJG59_008119 [Molossus molossus]